MALKTMHWSEEIWHVTEREEFQTCEITVKDVSGYSEEFDPFTGKWTTSGTPITMYSGQARFIPVRASVFEGGEGQANAMSVRAGRIQIPHSKVGILITSACVVEFTSSPLNGSLATRQARVTDDFQGSTTATRTFNVFLDADGVTS